MPVIPDELKYKRWEDFTGRADPDGSGEKDFLDFNVAFKAKLMALEYCYGDTVRNMPMEGSQEAIKTLTSDNSRATKSLILSNKRSGRNVVIIGPKKSGRSLLALLILKEVAWASFHQNHRVSWKYTVGTELLEAATWGAGKTLNLDLLDELTEVSFLLIDNVKTQNLPASNTELNRVFLARARNRLPTIMVFNQGIANIPARRLQAMGYRDGAVQNDIANPWDEIERVWGDVFVSVCQAQNNLVIDFDQLKVSGDAS
jgi:hypothetical protein